MERAMGPVLAKWVKLGIIATDWLHSTVFDLHSVDDICSSLPDFTIRRNEMEHCPRGRFIVIGDYIGDDDYIFTSVTFVNMGADKASVAGAAVDWEQRKIVHPDAACLLSDLREMEELVPSRNVAPTKFPEGVQALRRIASSTPSFLSALFKADYVRQVFQTPERRTPIGRALKLPMYELQRRTVKIDWFSYYQTNPSCRQNLPAGASALPLHDVVQHWCERQMSGDPRCSHNWHFADEHHKDCTKCGRVSWFRDTFYRGSEKNGVIIHDYVTGKRYKVAA